MTALAVILSICKVVGIVLLCVLGVVLAVLLLVLFVPLRYEISADIREPSPDVPDEPLAARVDAQAGFSWLLKLLRGTFVYPIREDGAFQIFVAFFRVFPRKRREGRPEKKRPRRRKDDKEEIPMQEAAAEGGGSISAQADKHADGPADGDTWAPLDAGPAEGASQKTGSDGHADAQRADAAAEETAGGAAGSARERIPLRARIARLRDALNDFSQKPEVAAKKIYYTISGIYAKVRKTRATIESQTFARAKQLLLNEARRVVRHLLPRKCRVDVTYGADDPKKTADVYSAVCMLYPVFEERVRMTPVFDGEALCGTVRIKGRVIVAVLLFVLLRVFFSRDVRRVVKRFKAIWAKDGAGDKEENRNGS